MADLLARLGSRHPAYEAAAALQIRLLDNLARARYGDTPSTRAERVEILTRCDALSREALDVPFHALCGLEALPSPPTSASASSHVTVDGGQVGVIGDGAQVQGGIHLHTHAPAGGIRAGKIEAENVVDGVLLQGGSPEAARSLVALANAVRRGGITADEIRAGSVVSGLHFVGEQAPTTAADLRAELAALRERVTQAIEAGEIAKRGDAEDVATALAQAATELEQPQPDGERVVRKLESAAKLLTAVAGAAQAAGQVGAQVIQLAPLTAMLWKLAQTIVR
jgi:hypothetical protein